jgi:polysaccharide biosynthesis protein PslA
MAQLVKGGEAAGPVAGNIGIPGTLRAATVVEHAAVRRETASPGRRARLPVVPLYVFMPLIDLVGLAIIGWLGYELAFDEETREHLRAQDQGLIPGVFTAATTVCAALICLIVHAIGGYRKEVVLAAGRSAATIISGILIAAGFLFVLEGLVSMPRMLEAWLMATSLILVPAAAVWRIAALFLVPTLLSATVRARTSVVLGAGSEAERFMEHLNRTREPLPEILACFDDRTTRISATLGSVPCRGNVDDLVEFVRAHAVDEVIVALPWSAEERLATLIERLKVLPVDIQLSPYGFGYRMAEPKLTCVAGLPLLTVVTRPLRASDAIIKAIEDWVVGFGLLLLFLPIMAIITLAIRLDSPGPILFRQPRHGCNNRVIYVYKFRTMFHAATDLTGGQQTARDDDRVTRVGRFLRRSSLDELPQLFNVLLGNMSVVGPRPHPIGMRTEEKLCQEIVSGYAQRHKMKPGITGWAQIHGWRGATETGYQLRKRVEHDIYYVESWSLWLDIKILLLTAFKGFRSPNAF